MVVGFAVWLASLFRTNGQQSTTFDRVLFDRIVNERHFDDSQIKSIVIDYEQRAKALASNIDELRSLITYIDLTTLAGDDTTGRVHALVDRAIEPTGDRQTSKQLTCAAVCVYPARVADVCRRLHELHSSNQKIAVASVAGGFPSGQYRLESRLLEVKLAVADGATEIDIVINRAAALDGCWDVVFDEVHQMKVACQQSHLKTILATGELQTLDNVYRASWATMMAGSDFIKTSTGKETVNATLIVAYVMCTAIKQYYERYGRKIGFKPAGGIRTVEEALAYRILVEEILGVEWLAPKLFRIGASTLLDNVVTKLRSIGG